MSRHRKHDSDPFAELPDSIPELIDECKTHEDQDDDTLYERVCLLSPRTT